MASGLFIAATAFFVWFFVYELAKAPKHEVRTGVATYALLTGLTAVGLWMRRSWGQSIGLLLAMVTAGLGVIALLAALLSHKGSPIVALVVLVSSAGTAYWLSRL